ncbi:hypothetical protein E4U59_007338 [Claviceps monticola]|nr:hypothetical protein E4U59_007338 [Claviceps monticola]
MGGQSNVECLAVVCHTLCYPEKIKSATDRCANQVKRVTSVIDGHLKKHKMTYSDLMFVFLTVAVIAIAKLDTSEYAAYSAWSKRLTNRSTVAKILKQRDEAIAANH